MAFITRVKASLRIIAVRRTMFFMQRYIGEEEEKDRDERMVETIRGDGKFSAGFTDGGVIGQVDRSID